jgi:hypothetical protein
MGVTQIDTKKIISEITDELVKKGLTDINEIKIEPFAIGAYVHANVSIKFYEKQKIETSKAMDGDGLYKKEISKAEWETILIQIGILDEKPVWFPAWDEELGKIKQPESTIVFSVKTQLNLLLRFARKLGLDKAVKLLEQILV